MSFVSFVGRVREKVIDQVSKNMEQGLAQGASSAREYVRKDTRQTEESIGYYWDRATLTGTIYAGTPWAAILEKRYPYLRPALAEVGRAFGLARVEGQFANVAEKYQSGLRGDLNGGRHRVVIGHRARPRKR